MSMEVHLTSKPIPVVAATQDAKSNQKPTHLPPFKIVSPSSVGTKGSSRGTISQSNQTPPLVSEKCKQSSVSGGRGERADIVGTNTEPVPSLNSASIATMASATENSETHQPEMLQSENDSESTSEGPPGDEVVQEAALETQITELWSSHERKNNALRRNRGELATLRNSLGERLFELKQLHARPGRSGRWAAFLRRENIPRATANRYVERWKVSIDPKPEKRLTESFTSPSNEEITQMVRKLKPKLNRRLTSPESVALFMIELAAALQPPKSAA
ncbi:hypothetical protein [Tunturiibacter gelidoferens]|uniref:Uncharacterized protein n=1 Tax=Tunturiibacter lichenicola TaxID=2051959 RepID=A0A7Y9NQW8_9BACT|nr:hypothetical protein [Edaphobacter lichenicola]NYF53920.1 hypothetical protein [Edaphobacter lichenicola]